MSREDELAAIDAAIAAGQLHRITPDEAAEAATRPILLVRSFTRATARRASAKATLTKRAVKMREVF